MLIYKKSSKSLAPASKNFAGSSPSKRGFSRLIARRRITSGFTLLELLLVVAIIGLMSSVIITSVNTSRAKSKLARAQATMSGTVFPLINICLLDEEQLSDPASGNLICPNVTDHWPSMTDIGGGWSYEQTLPTIDEGGCAGTCLCSSDLQPPYEICARGNTGNTNERYGIRCSSLRCETFLYSF